MTGLGDPAVDRIVLWCHPAPGAGGFDPDPVVTGRRGAHVVAVDQAAYAQGTVGVADDAPSYADDDWGFDLARVQAPVLLVHGAKDAVVPSRHGRWYRRRLPSARLTVVPRAGRLVVAPAWARIMQHVDPQRGSRSDA